MKNTSFFKLAASAVLFSLVFIQSACDKEKCRCERTTYSSSGGVIGNAKEVNCPTEITSPGIVVTEYSYNDFGEIDRVTETIMVCD